MSTETKIIGTISFVTLLVFIGFIFFATKNNTPEVQADQSTLVTKDSQKIWNEAAEVTIVEFADFQCPACAAAQPVIRQIVNEYKGKVNVVFRHFPLPQHQNAVLAANAAEAAGKSGKFWEMYDMLYEKQREWAEITDPTPIFISYAQSLGLNTDAFKNSLTTHEFIEKIQSDKTTGEQIGVNSTPTFFINGEKLVGVPNRTELKRLIDTHLGT